MSKLTNVIRRLNLFGRRSIENPSVPLSEALNDGYGAIGGGTSAAGVTINRETALTYSPVWRAVNLISRDLAKLPLHVYRRVGGGKERATDLPVYTLLRRKPNSEMTSYVFRQTLCFHALMEGNAYAYIDRAGDGTPAELIPLPPGTCSPVRVAGKLMYQVTINGQTRAVAPDNMIHVKGLSVDGLLGYRLYAKAKNSLGLGIAAEEFGSRYFSNGAEPSAVLEMPNKMSPEAIANLKASWNAKHQGVENSHKLAVIEEGGKLNIIGNNARNAQLIETRQFSIREVANWFGVPPHKLGDTTRTAYASLEQENQSYLDDALDPWLVAFEEEFHDKLLTEQQKQSDDYLVEFLRQALVRANLTDRTAFYNGALQAGWMNRDEVRGLENLNPLPNNEGQKFFIPLNMALSGGPGGVTDKDGGEDPGEPDVTDETDPTRSRAGTARAIVRASAQRMAIRIETHAKKAQKAGQNLEKWGQNDLISAHRSVILNAIRPGIDASNVLLKREIDPEKAADWLICRANEAMKQPDFDLKTSLPEEFAGFVTGEK